MWEVYSSTLQWCTGLLYSSRQKCDHTYIHIFTYMYANIYLTDICSTLTQGGLHNNGLILTFDPFGWQVKTLSLHQCRPVPPH